MVVIVTPATSEGSASGIRTLVTISRRRAPAARAASTSPPGTSRSDVSTIRAKKGMVAIASGTIAAVVPIVVPTSARVIGITATSRMMNGTERPMLTIGADQRGARAAARGSARGR